MIGVGSYFIGVEGGGFETIFITIKVDLFQFGKGRRDDFGLCQPILLLLLFIKQLIFAMQK